MLLQPRGDLAQLRVALRHALFQFGDVHRRANAGHHVFALRVDQDFAVKFFLAGGRIARKAYACAAGLTQVAEDHGLNVDRRAQIIGNVVDAAINLGALVFPGAEHCITRSAQLLQRLLREIAARMLAHHLLILRNDLFQIVSGQVGIELHAALLLLRLKHLVECMLLDVENHVAVHLDQAAVGIISKALVVRLLRQRLHATVIQSQVKDGIHHARHREFCARADAHQQRALPCSQFLPLQLLQPRQRIQHLPVNCL